MKTNRGMLTAEIKAKSERLLGTKISTGELRLMPYVVYCLTNGEQIDNLKITDKEREILTNWRLKKFIGGSIHSELIVQKKFWDAMHELIWLGYVK